MGANLAWLFIGKVHLSGLHPITRRRSNTQDLDCHDTEQIRQYFHELYNADLDRNDIQALRMQLNFPEVSEKFHMIDDRTRAVLVPYDEAADAIIQRLLKSKGREPGLLREIQRCQVGLYPSEFKSALEKGAVYELWEGAELWACRNSCYSPELGLEISSPSPDEYLC